MAHALEVLELKLSDAELTEARKGKVIKRELVYEGDWHKYRVEFQIGKKGVSPTT